MATKIRYNKELLLKCMERDGFWTDINGYEKLKREMRISFTCQCGNGHHKTFISIVKGIGGFCKNCSVSMTQEKVRKTCLEKFGVEYALQNKEVRDKIKKTCLQKYGTECSFQNEEVQEKIKRTNRKKYGSSTSAKCSKVREQSIQTCLQRYGTDYSLQNEEVKRKIQNTNIQKYGVKHSLQSKAVRNKCELTNMQRFGVRFASQSKQIQEKMREKFQATCLARYGVRHPYQNAEVAEKALKKAYKLKQYTFPDGDIREVQGYEPFALDFLVSNYRMKSQDIVTKRTDVPNIWYTNNGKKCRYYPDIFIPHKNKIIEVKSKWTYEQGRNEIFLKGDACKNQGFMFEVWIFDAKGNLIVEK